MYLFFFVFFYVQNIEEVNTLSETFTGESSYNQL